MKLPWISREKHEKELALKNKIIQEWINKCNKLVKENEDLEDNNTTILGYNGELAKENLFLGEYNKELKKRVHDLERALNKFQGNNCKLKQKLHAAETKLNKVSDICDVLSEGGME